jgi:transposase
MTKRRTLLIVQQGFYGLAIQRGRTADLFTCPQTAAALGVSVRWVHKYVRNRRRGLLYQLGRPLLWRAEVGHLQRELKKHRMALTRQRTFHPKVTRRKP